MYSQIGRSRLPGSKLKLRIRVSVLVAGLLATSAPVPGAGSVQPLPKHQLSGAYSCNPGIANYSCSWQINESYTTASAGSCNMQYQEPNGVWVTDYYSCSLWGSGGFYKSLPMVFFCYAGNCGAYPAGLMQLWSPASGWTYTYCTDFGAVMNSTASERYQWNGTGGNRTKYIASAFGASNPSWMTAGNPGNWGVGRDMFAGAQSAIWALLGVQVNSIRTWNGSRWVTDANAMNYYNEALADSNAFAGVSPYSTQPNHDQDYLGLSTNTVTTTTPPSPQAVTVTWHAMWPYGQPQSGEAVTLTVNQANTNATFSGGVTTISGNTDALGNFTTTLTVSQGPPGAITKVDILASSSTANLVNAGFSENGNQILIDSAFGLHKADSNQQTQTLNVQVPVTLGTPIWPAGQLETIPGPTYPNPPGSQNTYVNIPTCVGVAQAFQPSGYAPAAPAGFRFQTVLKPDPNNPSFYLNFGDGSGDVPFVYDAGNLPAGQLVRNPQYFGNGVWDASKPNGVDTACKTPAHFYGQVFSTSSRAAINARQSLLYQECAVDNNGNGPFGQPDCTPWSPVTFTATKSIAVYQIEGIPYVQ